jgi:hypothetical protein
VFLSEWIVDVQLAQGLVTIYFVYGSPMFYKELKGLKPGTPFRRELWEESLLV